MGIWYREAAFGPNNKGCLFKDRWNCQESGKFPIIGDAQTEAGDVGGRSQASEKAWVAIQAISGLRYLKEPLKKMIRVRFHRLRPK